LRELRLVRRVGGEELAPRDDRADGRRDVPVVDAGAEEAWHVDHVDVLLGNLGEVAEELCLVKGRRKIELALDAQVFGDLSEQVVDRLHADRRQHLAAILLRVGNVGH
jgi:hypothetical protein